MADFLLPDSVFGNENHLSGSLKCSSLLSNMANKSFSVREAGLPHRILESWFLFTAAHTVISALSWHKLCGWRKRWEKSQRILLLHVLLYFISPICKCVLACSFHGCPCAHGCVWQITVTARCQVHLDGNMVTICSERLFQLHLWRRVALWWKCHVFVWLL